MAVNTDPVFENTPNHTEVTFVNGDGTSSKTIFTADATNGSVITGINVHSTDSAAVTLDLFINDGATSYALGAKVVPIGAGSDGSEPAVDMCDPAFIPFFAGGQARLPGGYTIEAAPQAAVTAAKTVTIVSSGADYDAV